MPDKESKPKFSFRPDKFGKDDRGGFVFEDRNPYIMLGAEGLNGHQRIFYTPKTNEYWLGEGRICPKEKLETEFAQRLTWAYDEIEETKDGGKINVFPPTPANIKKMRKKILDEKFKAGERVDYDEVEKMTSPVSLKNHPEFDQLLKKTAASERLARRINARTRY